MRSAPSAVILHHHIPYKVSCKIPRSRRAHVGISYIGCFILFFIVHITNRAGCSQVILAAPITLIPHLIWLKLLLDTSWPILWRHGAHLMSVRSHFAMASAGNLYGYRYSGWNQTWNQKEEKLQYKLQNRYQKQFRHETLIPLSKYTLSNWNTFR